MITICVQSSLSILILFSAVAFVVMMNTQQKKVNVLANLKLRHHLSFLSLQCSTFHASWRIFCVDKQQFKNLKIFRQTERMQQSLFPRNKI